MQRSFNWMQSLPEPRREESYVIRECPSYGFAARLSLKLKQGGPYSESWLASRIGVSKGYLSRLMNGKQEMPDWILRPIAWATGSQLILQYHELQRALKKMERGETTAEHIARLANQARYTETKREGCYEWQKVA